MKVTLMPIKPHPEGMITDTYFLSRFTEIDLTHQVIDLRLYAHTEIKPDHFSTAKRLKENPLATVFFVTSQTRTESSTIVQYQRLSILLTERSSDPGSSSPASSPPNSFLVTGKVTLLYEVLF
jgi:hypothetical protein